MTTVLFADRDGRSLGPLAEATVPALFPIGSTPLLERTLESLVAAGDRAALLVVGPRALEIEKRFGKGIRWGIALEYVRREEDESPGDVLRRLEQRLDGDTFAVRADAGVEPAIREFLEAVRGRDEPVLAATRAGRPLGLWKIRPDALKKAHLPRDPSGPDWVVGREATPVELSADVTPYASLEDFWKADREAKTVAVSPRAAVSPKAKLTRSSVAEEAAVLEDAQLSGVTVLPRTVVPPGVSVADAIVSQNLVVDPRTGAATFLTDRLPAPGAARWGGAADRLLGLLLFVLALPLWPIAFLWSLVANAGHATRPFVATVNRLEGGRLVRGTLETFRFESAIPVFRDLPLLLAVASGRLALAGVAPLPKEEEAARRAPWDAVRAEAPSGLLARSRMATPPSAPLEVARVVDAFDARRGPRGLLGLGVKTLFSARAFLAPKGWNPDELPPASG